VVFDILVVRKYIKGYVSLLPGNANFGDIPSTLTYVDMDLYIFAYYSWEGS
jgi:hypothetical protein